MVQRERFVTPLTCPQCALNGSATWEEDEGGNLETTIKSISRGFMIGPGTEIYCDDCYDLLNQSGSVSLGFII